MSYLINTLFIFKIILDCSQSVALGMESGSIIDSQITASSFSSSSTPTYSRLNLPGGWTPTFSPAKLAESWLMVEFKVKLFLMKINQYWVLLLNTENIFRFM